MLLSLVVMIAISWGVEIRKIDLQRATDPDFRSLKNQSDWIEAESHIFRDEHRRVWRLQVLKNRILPLGPSWFVPHDDENDAFLAGIYAIKRYGGRLIALDCSEKRLCGGIDPNRYFLRRNRVFVDYIMDFYRNDLYPIFTLHNNHDKHQSTGGRGVIDSAVRRPYRGGESTYNAGDSDNLLIFADNRSKQNSPMYRSYSRVFDQYHLNYIFEYIGPGARVHGHMSAYVVRNTRREYFNIESEHGQLYQQKYLVDRLVQAFKRNM